jgi:putative ABC transport system ATP-binding protein
MRRPVIELRNVTKTYTSGKAAFQALTDVSLDVEGGEVILMRGPSGSGKTTLLSIMGCILRPTSGSVVICGRDVTALGEQSLPGVRLAHIGFVFQSFNLFPALTAGENVELALRLKGLSSHEARGQAAGLLEQVGLADKVRSLPADMSGGQKQRVAIARALAGEPDIILADEPTAALDSRSGRAVMDLLSGLARDRGRAVVIVTHDNRILDYADRTLVIEDGRLFEPPAQDAHSYMEDNTCHANQYSY